MPYKCDIKEMQEYLRVDVTGDWTHGQEKEDAFNVWKQVAKEYQKGKTFRVLSVWNVPGHLPTMSAYELGNKIRALGFDYTLKLAVVHLHEDRLQDSLFAETVAVNRGFNVKIFSDDIKALSWLLS